MNDETLGVSSAPAAQAGHARLSIPVEALLEAAPDAMVIVDEHGFIQLVNSQTEILFGYPRRDLVGQPVESLLPVHARPLHVAHRSHFVDEPLTRLMGTALELSARRRDGSEFPVEISLSPLETEDGLLVTASIRDVTARKQIDLEREQSLEGERRARREVEQLQAISDIGFAHLDLDMLLCKSLAWVHDTLDVESVTILLHDPTDDVLLPWATKGLEEEIGAGIRIPVGEGFAGRVAAERRTILGMNLAPDEIASPVLRAAGVRSLLGVPLLVDDRLIGILRVGTSQVREFSDDDQRTIQMIADRLARAVDNALVYRDANEAVGLCEEMLSVAAHELNTPLTTVQGWLQLLIRAVERQERTELDPVVAYARNLQAEANRLTGIVDDLLDTARAKQGRIVLGHEPVDLVPLARSVLDRFEWSPERTARHELYLVAPGEVLGIWDLNRIDQVLTNLVSNAVKYSPEGGEVRVELYATDEGVVIEVHDQGIGIDAADVPTLFQPFQRTDVARRSAPGTGLGLYITRQIVEQHGGTIGLESELGIGTRVKARLPRHMPGLDGAFDAC
jgi:PAS domain S-box-containing protein